ncbi:hypothetical protein [Planomonospora venezuelensis]|uniref:Uncharacterized protein n=1 Tax=Planomonospora venezuelensis TaxID=1999 RepID=A0A841CT93_PLAVE|nr:hypothetical protein [Planomonospora venezuelensis]MBB5961642.1 hypothetical protein [Planomonospora venezuelensis]GIM98788.1 hypothetical protein Pve01_04470 [Planomonospora venezuelensis]
MSELYCEPPHLTVGVYGRGPEADTFAALCSIMPEVGGSPVGTFEVAPIDLSFDLLSDLGTSRRVIKASGDRLRNLLAGEDADLRVVKAAFSHRAFGPVVVEYILKYGPDRHPVGVTTSAGTLGMPDWTWSKSDRRKGRSLAAWSVEVLRAAAERCKPLYGAVGVEFSLPTPQQLVVDHALMPTEMYLSRKLLGGGAESGAAFRGLFPQTSHWSDGMFVSAWDPYVDQGNGLGSTDSIASAVQPMIAAMIRRSGR